MHETPLSLLDRLRRHPDDQPSWRRLAMLYGPWVRAMLLRHDTPEADAEDLTQDVLLVLAREIGRFEHNGRPGAFRFWVRSIVANRLRGYWRSRQAGPVNGLGEWLDQLEDPDSELGRAWDREHDASIVQRLLELIEPEFAPSTWQGFRLVVLEERPVSEVAERLGLTSNAVLIAKSRVLRRLRQEGQGLID
jgi:RNA polymerase sigma-70 factor (ECF subfamily)